MDKTENVLIIGGGIAGLSAGIYLARASLKPVILAGSPPGGQLSLTSEVENFPGHPSILGPELVERMRKQAASFGATIIDENVTDVDFKQNQFHMTTGSGATHQAKSVLIATGARALWLGLESEQRLRGRGVSACATCDGFFFRNKEVAVIGGGDSALEEALVMTRFASKVYLIHRRDTFAASKIMQQRVMAEKKIEIIWNASVSEVQGDQRVECLRLKVKDEQRSLPVQGVFVAIGHQPATGLFQGKIELDKKGYVMTTSRAGWDTVRGIKAKTELFDSQYQTATSIKGIFAAGDCVDFVYRQATTAAGMGVAAALDIEHYLEAHS